jgi:hypothetical protein
MSDDLDQSTAPMIRNLAITVSRTLQPSQGKPMSPKTVTKRTTTPHALEQRKRQDEALALRRAGHDYATIATQLRYASRGAAHNAVTVALDRQPAEDAAIMRRLELERLDELLRVAWIQVHMDHVLVQDGRVITVEDSEGVKKPLIDHAGKMAALDRVIRIMERRAKLMGLDAPTRKVIEVYSDDALNAEIRRLESQLPGNDPKVEVDD